MPNQITIENVCPIEKLAIPLKPGIVVLRGGQGTGKSTAQRAISRAIGGNGQLSVRDGAKRGGVELGDATVSVTAKRCRVTGEMEFESLEGSLDLASLVDPGIKDEERADAARIKALVSLSGVSADPSVYYEMCGGAEAFASLGVDTDTDCPILLAARVKAALEKRARAVEAEIDGLTDQINAIKISVDGVDMDVDADEDLLKEAYRKAVRTDSQLIEQRENAKLQRAAVAKAQETFDRIAAEYSGPTVDDAQVSVDKAILSKDKCAAELREAQSAFDRAKQRYDMCESELQSAKNHAATVASLKETLATEIIEPSEESIAEATAEVWVAEQAIELGSAKRKAHMQVVRSDALSEMRSKSRKESQHLRDAATSVDVVLSNLIPESALRIEAGRLVTETDRSKSELYAELSDGERWKLAIDLGSNQLGETSLMVIPQIAWEGLTESTRKDLQAHIVERGIVAVAAEAMDGPLRTELFDDV